MDEFVIVPKLGMLRYDKIFFETYYPVLFTCRDNENNLFLCVCCQCNKDGKKWLLSKTTPDIIIKILKNKTTMREAFLVFKDVRLSIYWNKEKPKPVLDISYNTPLFIGMSHIMKQINFADTRDEYTVCKKDIIYLSCAS